MPYRIASKIRGASHLAKISEIPLGNVNVKVIFSEIPSKILDYLLSFCVCVCVFFLGGGGEERTDW